MAGITVTREDLQSIGGSALTVERFNAVERTVLGLIRTVYRRDPALATGREADVLNAVFTSAALRLIANPTGARSVGLGSANVTFGGSDEDVSNAGSLTEPERTMLRSLRRPRPTSVSLEPYYGHVLIAQPAAVADLEGYEEVP